MLSRKSTLTLRRVSCLITVMELKLTRLSKRVETRLHKKLKFSLKRLIKRLLNRRRYNKQTLQRLRRLMSRFLLAQVRHQMSKMYSSEQPIRDLTHITLTYHLMRTTFLSLLLTVQTQAGKPMSASSRSTMPNMEIIVISQLSLHRPSSKIMRPVSNHLVMEMPSKQPLTQLKHT